MDIFINREHKLYNNLCYRVITNDFGKIDLGFDCNSEKDNNRNVKLKIILAVYRNVMRFSNNFDFFLTIY